MKKDQKVYMQRRRRLKKEQTAHMQKKVQNDGDQEGQQSGGAYAEVSHFSADSDSVSGIDM